AALSCQGSRRMWEIVRAGGPLMWPIILCSITGAAIVLERLWTLQDKRVLPQELPERVWQLIEANQVNDKVIATLEQNSPPGGLAEALICTVAGRCAAMPPLIFYRYRRGRVEGIVVQMEKHAIRMADALEAARLRERTSPAAAA